jgi:four helix bundle protein
MERVRDFTSLVVWQKAHAFVLHIYAYTSTFPKEELYGLTSQLRRAVVSTPANIAEGYKKPGIFDKLRFYNIAQGSLEEARYYLILSQDLNYGDSKELSSEADEVARLLTSYIEAIKKGEGRRKERENRLFYSLLHSPSSLLERNL